MLLFSCVTLVCAGVYSLTAGAVTVMVFIA